MALRVFTLFATRVVWSSASACFELRALRSLSDTDTSARGYWARLLSRLLPRGSEAPSSLITSGTPYQIDPDPDPSCLRRLAEKTPYRIKPSYHCGFSARAQVDLGALIGSYLMTIMDCCGLLLRLFAVGNSQSLVRRPWFGFT